MTRLKSVALTLPILLALVACSKAEMSNSAGETGDASTSTTPDIGLTAAPGVAFSYDYRFGLEALKIASLQERHAAACEALGIDKCRITGLSFNRQGAEQAQGTLELALAPELARRFGRDAIAAVEAAKGNVASIEIDGVDRSSVLEGSAQDAAVAKQARETLEREIARPDARAKDRAELLKQIDAQRAAERDAQARGAEASKSLATTPMRFTYSTEGFLPGFSIERTTGAALGFAGMILNALLAVLVTLGVLAVPIGLGALGIAHLARLASRAWRQLAPSPQPDLG